MSPLNRGPLLGPRAPPTGVWPPPPPRFGGRLPPPGMPPRMPGMPPPPMSGVFGPMRQRLPHPPRPGGVSRPGGPPPLFVPRGRGIAPLVPPMGLRGTGPRGPHMPGWPRRIMPPQILPHMRPRFPAGNGNTKGKLMNNAKKISKLEELELKKPWMTDEIRSEIQKKNKLYAKAKKNKDAKEWEEFKDLRNKVTRMIRDAKNEYLSKHPEQGGQKTDDKSTIESEGVQKTENASEKSEQKEQSEQSEQSEQMEQMEETQPSSEQAHLYVNDEEPYDRRDENFVSSEEEETFYCEVCDRDFCTEENLSQHKETHKLCGIDGCTFSAHPLLVQRHISMQHSSGLYGRLRNLSTPEDIQKWIAERKKRYPTKANIEIRKAEELEKRERGEIIKQKNLTVTSKSSQSHTIREKRRKHRKRPLQVHNDAPICTTYRGLQPFPGTLNVVKSEPESDQLKDLNNEENISDNEIDNISDEDELMRLPCVVQKPENILPSLVANYGSDSADDEAPEEVPIKKIKTMDEESIDSVSLSNDTKNCSNTDLPTTSIVNNVLSKSQKNKRADAVQCKTKNVTQSTAMKKQLPRRLNLLGRLLARSIQHERNLICQCVKYIIDNNFFDQ